MSELSLSTSSNQYDYMININPSLVQKVSSPVEMNTSPPVATCEDPNQLQQQQQQQQQYAYQAYGYQQMPLVYPTVYPVARFDQPAYYNPQRLVQRHPNSPESVSSRSSPPTPPSSTKVNHHHHHQQQQQQQEQPTAIMRPSTSTSSTSSSTSSSSISTNHHIVSSQTLDATSTTSPMMNPMVPSSFSNATSARVKETIARANSVPMEFYQTEFLEYSKETYERKMDAKRNKRKRSSPSQKGKSSMKNNDLKSNNKRVKKQQSMSMNEKDGSDDDDDDDDDEDDGDDDLDDEMNKMANAVCRVEMRRQIHIQSEQKRRAQIKDGFDELRKHLPGCNNKKMSKAALLTRTVQQLQHMKVMQTELLSEVERLVQENDDLKKFQHDVLQRQAMEKMYNF
ncbi:hypothetical protein BCR42DRAFT_404435 [Absidia repens]|uniref:BHLH domain-containing protein n=1 Tax=Absidia repens TaxID=90262 RepID=A0A1X2IW77_9FUNG|nr:hypothetical protein BCR42DRAFT_404435 [Absidia repens]